MEIFERARQTLPVVRNDELIMTLYVISTGSEEISWTLEAVDIARHNKVYAFNPAFKHDKPVVFMPGIGIRVNPSMNTALWCIERMMPVALPIGSLGSIEKWEGFEASIGSRAELIPTVVVSDSEKGGIRYDFTYPELAGSMSIVMENELTYIRLGEEKAADVQRLWMYEPDTFTLMMRTPRGSYYFNLTSAHEFAAAVKTGIELNKTMLNMVASAISKDTGN